jgi:hypothetical protein
MLPEHRLKYLSSRSQAGLTMVEIAIVFLVIAGIMMAILGYDEIVRTARLRKIASEVQSFGIAARTFEQKYEALPGDFADAGAELPGCAVNPDGSANNPNFCRNGNGDGRIGRYCHYSWAECGQTGRAIPSADPNGNDVRLVSEETTQFWKHLYLAGLIQGIVDPRYNPNSSFTDPATRPRWGYSHPESAVWEAGYIISGQGAFIGGSVDVNFFPSPEYVPSSAAAPTDMGNNRTMTVVDAHYIDEKYDNDGPGTGAIWWGPITKNGTGCRHDDGQKQNTWESANTNNRNCVFTWTIF